MCTIPTTDHGELPVMTVDYAHRVMQTHLTCPVSVCPVKNQAKRRLVECGVLVPSDAPHVGS